MNKLLRRIVYLTVAGAVVLVSTSGCVVVPEHGYYYHRGYEEPYWVR